MMKNKQKSKLAIFMLVSLAGLTACDSGDDPDVQAVPMPATTTAAIDGNFIKGTLAGAELGVLALNGTQISVSGQLVSDTQGRVSAILTTAPGYAFNGMHRLTATVVANSQMICDAVLCGDTPTGGELDATDLGAVQLHTLLWLRAPLGSNAGTAVAFQVNALTHFTSQLLTEAVAGGRNITALATFEPAQLEFSNQLLRILGVDLIGVNLFQQPLHSAESATVLAELTPLEQRLSLLNAAFAGFEADSTLAAHMQQAAEWLQLAAAGDVDAAILLRQQLAAALAQHHALTELGFEVDDILDLDLPLFQASGSSGPIRSYTKAAYLQGATITARGAISEAENELSAFDGDVQTKWLDNTAVPSAEEPGWLQLSYAEPVAINVLSITSANDAPDRDPENFRLLASQDGEQWLVLGSWAGERFEQRFEVRDFAFSNTLPYQHYRLEISKNRGDSNLMQLAEIELFGPVYPHQLQQPASISARGAISASETADKAFDKNVQTKWLDNTAVPTDEDPSWVEVSFAEAASVSYLAITSANDAPDRDPENFRLLASTDGGANWLELASFTGEAFDHRFQRRLFSLNNQLAFSNYRLEISKNKGDSSLMQIAEIELIGSPQPSLNHALNAAEIEERGAIGEGEAGIYAVDGDSTTKWLDNTAVPSDEEPSWIQLQLAESQAVTMLALTSANDAPERDPENFSLLASHDGDYWVRLGHWTGVSFDERFQRQSFALTNQLGFTHYRLDISKNKGDSSLMQVAEIELIGPVWQAVNHSLTGGASITERASISEGESGAKAFDNNPNSKWLDNAGVPSEEEPAWVELVLPQSVIVHTLAVTSANDAPSRDPENFRLLGSDNGSDWQLLGTWSGESFAQRFERREFPFLNGRDFSHYRIEITKNKGDDSLMQVANFELIGPAL
ncbi:discoidin domain-containing protein [Alkalimonas sp. NCh-2]|uniref:discoidin domain-containing protein n=1 Tax=Alkalimonas sp. NCh-2 TaxID=3144846 RepID=UPI0031F6A437